MAEAISAGQVGGRKAVRGGEGDFNRAGGRQVRAETRAGLPIKGGERAHHDRGDGQFVLLQDDEADAAAGSGVDAIPAEELFHGDRVMHLVGLTEIIGQGAETACIPPAPAND